MIHGHDIVDAQNAVEQTRNDAVSRGHPTDDVAIPGRRG